MIDTEWAFVRYEELRGCLPAAEFAACPEHVATLADVADRYDAFILDAFGVLNVGEAAIPGAVARMAQLSQAGKRLVVLTNGASYPHAMALAKYTAMGFGFSDDQVVASRDIAVAALARWPAGVRWSAITTPGAGFGDIAADVTTFDPGALDRADGFLFLGSVGWTAEKQAALIAALLTRPRPLIVANPDIVAPREDDFSLEPGHFAHQIAAATGVVPEFYGKPYPNAFAAALARIDPAIARHRIAMVGDTLHTDILGGRAAGIGTVLISRHGLFRGLETGGYIARSGIVPDIVAQTT